MNRKSRLVFLLLIASQAAHSVEEYSASLYDVLAPARFVSGLVSNNLAFGFAVINSALVAFGLWCYIIPVRSGGSRGRIWAWAWAGLELGNGTVHIVLALSAGSYYPGVITAPLLVSAASWLVVLLLKQQGPNHKPGGQQV